MYGIKSRNKEDNVMKNRKQPSKRRVVASVLSLLMIMQQSLLYQAGASAYFCSNKQWK